MTLIPAAVDAAVVARSPNRCELCGASDALEVYAVHPIGALVEERCAHLCAACKADVEGSGDVDVTRLDGLKDAAWSTVPAVQVLVLRLLPRVGASWADDLLGQIYVDDEVRVWAEAGVPESSSDDDGDALTVDSLGHELKDGDDVTLIQDLDVKGGGFTAKRGTLVKGIKLTGDPAYVEGKINKSVIVLKTKFLKKA